MDIGYSFAQASGVNLGDCHLLGYRFDAEVGFQPDAGDSWAMRFEGPTLHSLFWKRGWFTGLWRSLGGTLYVSDAASRIYIRPPDASRSYEHEDLPGTLTGLWGLDEDDVFVWGRSGGKPVMYRGHHHTWTPIAAPGFVIGVHGIRPDLIVAVGERGLIARWDGSAWQNMPSPADGTLSRVFVASDDEIYACGHGKQLLQGSVHGWVKLLEHSTPLSAIAKWKNEVWVGAGGDDGLCQLKNGKLVSLKPKIQATQIDARGDLLITCPEKVVESADGQKFMSMNVSVFQGMTKDDEPSWRD
jgi:hypothetical protein